VAAEVHQASVRPVAVKVAVASVPQVAVKVAAVSVRAGPHLVNKFLY
jgi:phage-related baseplate assembly protein